MVDVKKLKVGSKVWVSLTDQAMQAEVIELFPNNESSGVKVRLSNGCCFISWGRDLYKTERQALQASLEASKKNLKYQKGTLERIESIIQVLQAKLDIGQGSGEVRKRRKFKR